MDENSSTYTIRVPKDIKKAFEQATKAMDVTGAQILRGSMRDYVAWYMKTHAQQELITPTKPQTGGKKK